MKSLLAASLLLAPLIPVCAQQRASVPISTRTVVAVSTNSTGDAEADREHDALWTAWRAKPQEGLTRTNRAYWEWQDKVFKQFAADAEAFAKKHPKDARRWEAIVQSGYTPPFYITGFKPEFDDHPMAANLIVDEKAAADFKERQRRLVREVLLADDSNTRQRNGAFSWLLVEAQNAARKDGKKPELTQFEPLMVEVGTKLPDERGAELLATYMQLLTQAAPDEAKSFAAKLEGKPVVTAMNELAAKKEKERAAAKEALQSINSIKFTAADGREVDLGKLRGKVVLIDFWATWCGPCVAEIPNVVTNYGKYHGKGFEVVGITLENSGLTGQESAEDKDKKLAAAKSKMLNFTRTHDMPWPQYFDGQYGQNDYAVKYGIHAIPAMFLLDKDGKIASTEARGPELEKKIKELLGI